MSFAQSAMQQHKGGLVMRRELVIVLIAMGAAVWVVSFVSGNAPVDLTTGRVGTVVTISTGNQDDDTFFSRRLHFCVLEQGEQDIVYVGTQYGMWSNGEFDLTVDGRRVFTGNVPHLVYGGVIIRMGNVIEKQPKSNIGIAVTRISGQFK